MTAKSDGGGHAGHTHGPRPGSAAAEHVRPLTIAFALTVSYMIVEVIGGLVTGSLALLSDAAHMATDALGLGLALAAIQLSRRVKASQHTYGTYRLEVLAAVINGLLLFGVGGYVLYEAAQASGCPAGQGPHRDRRLRRGSGRHRRRVVLARQRADRATAQRRLRPAAARAHGCPTARASPGTRTGP